MNDVSMAPKWEPHSIEAEQCLLGAILVNNDALTRVSDILRAEHFFEPLHAHIYETCQNLISMGKLASPLTLQIYIAEHMIADGLPVSKYLARMAAEATTIVNAVDYALNIRDLAARRSMMDTGYQLQIMQPADTIELASKAIEELDTIITEHGQLHNRPVTMAQALETAVAATATAYENEGKLTGMSWGLTGLDHKTNGIQKTDLIIIAGRPGMGKTALGLCLARTLGKAGEPGMLFSLEMSSTPLAHRMISDEMYDNQPLSYSVLRSGKFPEPAFARITDAAKRMQDLPVIIDQQAALTLAQITTRARRQKQRHGLSWLMVDHIGLMKSGDKYRGNRVLEMAEISSGLKALAKELNIPVFALCQLNRQVESREDKRPQLSDLRNSGDIEQDADIVLMLYREAYYLERSEPTNARPDSEEYAAWHVKMTRCYNQLDIILEKQRNGPIGVVKAHCNIGCNAIRDIVEADHLPERIDR